MSLTRQKKLLYSLSLLICLQVEGQINVSTSIYTLSFSNSLHQPKYLSYYLYKGGGECNRNNYSFKCDRSDIECATDEDYKGKGYDKGHLANAEDFAFDCEKDELTFRYYNCLPQTPNLNRGIWKSKETEIRKWSQKERLLVMCGGFFRGQKIGKAAVPAFCWKVVQSVKSKEILFCGWFKNTSSATLEEISITELEARLNTRIKLIK